MRSSSLSALVMTSSLLASPALAEPTKSSLAPLPEHCQTAPGKEVQVTLDRITDCLAFDSVQSIIYQVREGVMRMVIHLGRPDNALILKVCSDDHHQFLPVLLAAVQAEKKVVFQTESGEKCD